MTTGLLIGDPHARPGVDNRRFDWLGKLIAEVRPTWVAQMGDLFDMPSLSSYDKGRKSFEGRRYKADLEAGHDALSRIAGHLRPLRRRYVPRRLALLGNHEERIARAVEAAPELEGTLSYNDLDFAGFEWEQHGFLEPVVVDGMLLQHYAISGLMGRPISGENHARTLLLKGFTSCAVGHSHLWDYKELTRADGRKIQAFVCGWYGDPEQVEAYAGPAQKLWWSGVTLLRGLEDGYAGSFERISIADLQRRYG